MRDCVSKAVVVVEGVTEFGTETDKGKGDL